MVIGWTEGVNRIVMVDNQGKRYTKKLGVKGLNICGEFYTYYDTKMQLHLIDTRKLKTLKLYKDKFLVYEEKSNI